MSVIKIPNMGKNSLPESEIAAFNELFGQLLKGATSSIPGVTKPRSPGSTENLEKKPYENGSPKKPEKKE